MARDIELIELIKNDSEGNKTAIRKCPYCAEEIQDEAILCRYCGHDLNSQKIQNEKTPTTQHSQGCATWPTAFIVSLVLAVIYLVNSVQDHQGAITTEALGMTVTTSIIWTLILAALIDIYKRLFSKQATVE